MLVCRKHIQTSHTRPFTCIFAPYSCPSTFGSKNEWKRHVNSQHLSLEFYRCDQCPTGPVANEFNRKDLFTQHLRRMHCPFPLQKAASAMNAKGPKKGKKGKNASTPEMNAWEKSLEAVRQACHHVRREPPPESGCPCCPHLLFSGENGWDDRMEHLGKHFEKCEVSGQEARDPRLEAWLIRERLLENQGHGWVASWIGAQGQQGSRTKEWYEDDMDADGEDE
jgi:hypothetical protein